MAETTAQDFLNDLQAAQDEVEKLQKKNIEKVKALANAGKTVDAAMLANVKIDTFIETFLDDQAKLVYVRNLEIKLGSLLDEALSQIRQEQLVQGVKGNKLFLPKG